MSTQITMIDTRTRISKTIREHPGIHFNELVRSLDLAPGQVQYHTRQLQDTEEILSEPIYGRRHYYPSNLDHWERRALALLRRETTGDIVAYLLKNGSTHPGRVAIDLEIARSTLEWHLDRLVEHGIVEKRRKEKRVTLVVATPNKTVKLLQSADPTLRKRLVGRFERLIDRLLTS